MPKRICCVIISMFLFSFSSAWASPWGVVANSGTGGLPADPGFASEAIYTLDLSKSPPQAYGPFLEGKLVPVDPITHMPVYGGGLLDVTPIPGTNDVLVSNYGGKTIYRINLSQPTKPILVGSVLIDDGVKSFFPEDIAVTSDGKLAIVTAGELKAYAAFINLDTLTLNSIFTLYEGVPFDPASPPDPLPAFFFVNAVAITPNDQTVIMTDYVGGRVVYGKINAARNGLESVNQLPLCPNWSAESKTCGADDYLSHPVNVAISPDGQTALLADASWGMVSVLRITGPGVVVKGASFQLWGLPDSNADYLAYKNSGGHNSRASSQSIAFAPGGRRAYILQNKTCNYTGNAVDGWTDNCDAIPDKLSWVQVDGPGQVSVGGIWAASLLSSSSDKWLGVETLAISEDGKYAYSGNPTLSGAVKNVTKVDLSTFVTSTIATNCSFPTGIGILAHDFNWSMLVPIITHGLVQ